jgi:CheY-like chemotaxis protein
VRAIARHVLQQHGCVVVEAENGSDALVAVERETTPFDLILTDVVMPGMTGFELARRLQERDAGQRVLFMSGYADQVGVPDAVVREGRFLSKPFTPDELWQRVVWLVEHAGTAGRVQ